LDACQKLTVCVGPGSTIRAKSNVYSVASRLRGEEVQVRVYAETIEVWYAQRRADSFPRLIGAGGHRINYRHVIGSLLRKPGAFEQYRYRDDMFPTSRFRMAYDYLIGQVSPARDASTPGQIGKRRGGDRTRGVKEYLKILELAATETEEGVDEALRMLLEENFSGAESTDGVSTDGDRVVLPGKPMPITAESIRAMLRSGTDVSSPTRVSIDEVDLSVYDTLLEPVPHIYDGGDGAWSEGWVQQSGQQETGYAQ
jgi:hypothetical protein